MRSILVSLAVGAMTLAPHSALSEDAALIIVLSNYERLAAVPGAQAASELAETLEARGFRVSSSLNQAAAPTLRVVEEFRENATGADRVLVFLSGHMMSSSRDAFLLTRKAPRPSDLTVGRWSVPIGPIIHTLAEHPGQAVLMLAPSTTQIRGEGLAPGAAPVAPQGVTIASGPPRDLVDLANDMLLVPGMPIGQAFAEASDTVQVSGFVSDAVPFLPAPFGATVLIEREGQPDMEVAFWDVVRTMAQVEAYQAYLRAYPNGRFAAQARDAIAAVEANAEAEIVAAENALNLDRAKRRAVQRHLSLLGFDPRGIDGIFGPGTRNAIAAWQRAEGYEETGYLDRQQLDALEAAGEARAAQLEAEAEARRIQQEQRDRAYWRDTGRNGDEAGLRAYLDKYPDGLFADVARARLDEIEAAARASAEGQELQFWDAMRAEDTIDAYRSYLDRYPNGRFSEVATARMNELIQEEARSDVIAAAKAEEARVVGNQVARLLAETRLKSHGFDPGAVDGTFDRQTRKAIRQFQRARGLTVTGYISGVTMAHLLTFSP